MFSKAPKSTTTVVAHLKYDPIVQPLKLYYFDMYGRGEPVRMALWKAGVEFEDVRVTGDSWKRLKNSGKLDFD